MCQGRSRFPRPTVDRWAHGSAAARSRRSTPAASRRGAPDHFYSCAPALGPDCENTTVRDGGDHEAEREEERCECRRAIMDQLTDLTTGDEFEIIDGKQIFGIVAVPFSVGIDETFRLPRVEPGSPEICNGRAVHLREAGGRGRPRYTLSHCGLVRRA